jgi:hypothetical protein
MYWLIGGIAILFLGLGGSGATRRRVAGKAKGKGRKMSTEANVRRWLPEITAAHSVYPIVPRSLIAAVIENESGGSNGGVRWECRNPDTGKLFGQKTPCPEGCQRYKNGKPVMSTGVMQFIISTGEAYGLTSTVEAATDERRNPAKAIMAGAHLLSDLLRKFDGSVGDALSAYNAGSGAVIEYKKKHGNDGYARASYVKHVTDKQVKYLDLD